MNLQHVVRALSKKYNFDYEDAVAFLASVPKSTPCTLLTAARNNKCHTAKRAGHAAKNGEDDEDVWEMDFHAGGWDNDEWVEFCLVQTPPRCPACGLPGLRSDDNSTCFGCDC